MGCCIGGDRVGHNVLTTQEIKRGVEIVLPDDAHTLSCQGVAHIVILVVEVIVSLKSQCATAIEQIFDVKITDKIAVAGVVGVVAVAKIAVEDETVVEQLAGESQIDLHVAKVAFLASEVRRDAPFLAHLSQHAREL